MANDIPNHRIDTAAYVKAPRRITSADAESWDDVADVVVVGFGGAGACAALEARSRGADVLVLERFEGGGATVLSGGIVYGGGTRFLREAGFADTPETMFRYLKLEVGDAVSDATLRRFCEQSGRNMDWLEQQGLRFGSRYYDGKTSYPGQAYDLYFSGNERVAGYREITPPVPRGHRPLGHNFTNGVLFAALRCSAETQGVRIRTQTVVTRLVIDADGAVVGVEASMLPSDSSTAQQHRRLIRRVNAYQRYHPPLALRTSEKLAALEREFGRPLRIRARGGVVLSTGSFAFNRAMVQQHASTYIDTMPVGTVGCDGSGVRLGETLGAATACMDRVSAWRNIAPPASFVKGIMVDRHGRRFVSEDAYMGKLGYEIAEHANGQAWLVVDRNQYLASFRDAYPKPGRSWHFYAPLLANLLFNRKKGRTVRELAARCGIDAEGLEATLGSYNAGAAAGRDEWGKAPDYLCPLGSSPYYAIDIALNSKRFPCPAIPMGGLVVDEESGTVLRLDGTPICGLYAAGRAAVGIPSGFYVSGTALADCVFSGRRAGHCAAALAQSS